MANFIRLLQKLDYMRMSLGICILIDGHPLIFFFRDALKLAPGSTTFTALGLGLGLVLMVPFTLFRRLYRPNETLCWMMVAFLVICIVYMVAYRGPQPVDRGKEMIYYAFMLLFLILLLNIPNDIILVVIPVIVLFTLLSNLGLIYSLIRDPNWILGQRATIVLNGDEDGSGNPHVFARNAFIGVIACAIWLVRPNLNFLLRLFALFAGILNIIILVLTQTRSSILALIIATALFMYFNVRPAQIRSAVRATFKPIPILVMVVGIAGIVIFFQQNYEIYGVLYVYVENFITRNLENVYAFLGMSSQGTIYEAQLDDSVANRAGNFSLLSNTFISRPAMLLVGYGYKFFYFDVPIVEILLDQGVVSFGLFLGINVLIIRHGLQIMKHNPNPLSVFLAYFYVLIFVGIFSGGRPYEVTYWLPYIAMMRFMGIEHLLPAYLNDNPGPYRRRAFLSGPAKRAYLILARQLSCCIPFVYVIFCHPAKKNIQYHPNSAGSSSLDCCCLSPDTRSCTTGGHLSGGRYFSAWVCGRRFIFCNQRVCYYAHVPSLLRHTRLFQCLYPKTVDSNLPRVLAHAIVHSWRSGAVASHHTYALQVCAPNLGFDTEYVTPAAGSYESQRRNLEFDL